MLRMRICGLMKKPKIVEPIGWCKKMTTICVLCEVEFTCKKNGVFVKYLYASGRREVFSADLYSCPNCTCSIVQGIAKEPYPYEVDSSDIVATVDFKKRMKKILDS